MTFKKIAFTVLTVLLWFVFCKNSGVHVLSAREQDRQETQHTGTYSIGPRDLITINVFGAPELNKKVRISGRGTITLPLLGEVKVSGLTAAQLETKLARLLEKKYLKNAQVTVFIEEYQSKMVAMIGAVERPGNYELHGKETLLQIISKAGGVTSRSSDRVVIIRSSKSTVINLEELMMKGTPELNILLEPGDIVNIPHVQYMDIYIFGEVQRPGRLQLKKSGEITLLQAIAQAGGFTNRARKSAILVKRKVNGEEKKIRVNANKIIKGKKPSFALQQNDIIYVKESVL